jgi:hypothetical protein
VLHCVILPLAAVLFIAVHFWRIRKDGGLYVQQSEPAKGAGEARVSTEDSAQEAVAKP